MVFLWLRLFAFCLGLFPLLYFIHAPWSSTVFLTDPCWLDLRFLPSFLQVILLCYGILSLWSFAFSPPTRCPRFVYQATLIGLTLLFCAALENTARFYYLWLRKDIYQISWVPFSLPLLLGISSFILFYVRQSKARIVTYRWQSPLLRFVSEFGFFVFCIIGIPFLQLMTFGKTDLRRSADVVVIFGTRTYADGRPSLTLASRMHTACQLYQQGYAHFFIVSGGPGDGLVHETEAMKNVALHCGIPAENIIQDPLGLSTEATVKNTVDMFKKSNFTRILVVSDFSHLVRIKLMYAVAGQEVYPVPAPGDRPLSLIMFQVRRELLLLWACYAKGFLEAE